MCCRTLSKMRSCAPGSLVGCCARGAIQPPTTPYSVSVAETTTRVNLLRNDIYLPQSFEPPKGPQKVRAPDGLRRARLANHHTVAARLGASSLTSCRLTAPLRRFHTSRSCKNRIAKNRSTSSEAFRRRRSKARRTPARARPGPQARRDGRLRRALSHCAPASPFAALELETTPARRL